jgi:hypothetical protein
VAVGLRWATFTSLSNYQLENRTCAERLPATCAERLPATCGILRSPLTAISQAMSISFPDALKKRGASYCVPADYSTVPANLED